MAYNSIYTKGTIQYKDFDISFLPNPSTGDLRVKTDADAIKQAIRLLVFTNYGERPFRFDISCNMERMLFEPLDSITKISLQKEIFYTLKAYEPRVYVTNVIVDDSQANVNRLSVTIYFTILNTQTQEKVQVFLNRVR